MDQALDGIFASLMAHRLVPFFGAGMSVGHGSDVPGAVDLARICAARYENALDGHLDSELHRSLERLTVHFLKDANQLEHVFTQTLVPWERFLRPHNKGHEALADFLLCSVVPAVVTTNVDTLCERAAEHLGEVDFQASWDCVEMSTHRPHAGYLKLHGCAQRDRHNLLWCREQLTDTRYRPLQERLRTSKAWLGGHLINKDLLFMGFWTDWSYLNAIFAEAVETIQPPRIIVVDILSRKALEEKAPDLFKWVNSGGFQFDHLQLDCVDFIAQLRERFSRHFVRRTFESARPDYREHVGVEYVGDVAAPAGISISDLYQLRRDLTGVPPEGPVRMSLG